MLTTESCVNLLSHLLNFDDYMIEMQPDLSTAVNKSRYGPVMGLIIDVFNIQFKLYI